LLRTGYPAHPGFDSAEVLSDLIGQIYDCALDPARWEPVVARVQELMSCINSVLAVQAIPSGRILLAVTSGIGPALLARVEDYGADVIDQWGGLEAMARHSLEDPVVLSWQRPRELWQGNRYYVEWAKPQGIVDVIGVLLARDPTVYGSVGFGRHVDAGPVTKDEIDTLRLLVPHFQRAVSISRMLDIKAIAVQSFEAALDAVPAGITLVDDDLRIIYANRAAQNMLSAGEPIASKGGKLLVPSAVSNHALAAAVKQANLNEALIGRRGFGIPARTALGDAAVLHVLPLRHGALRPGLNPAAAAAVFVAPATMPHPAPEQALAALFDLTPTEAKVLGMIGAGKTVAATAAVLGRRSGHGEDASPAPFREDRYATPG
jgi:PAS domain-containing protein